MYMANIWEERVCNAFRGITAAAPSYIYAGLLIENPRQDKPDGTEVDYSGYQRQLCTFSEPTENADDYGTGKVGIKNTNKIVFPKLSAAAGTAVGVGYWDSKTGGNLWAYSPISEGLTLDSNEEPTIRVGKTMLISEGDITKAFAVDVLNMMRGTSITGFNTYLGLANGDPARNGSEFFGSNYARKEVVFNAPQQQPASGQALISNSNEIMFNTPNATWGNWTYIVYYNSEIGGNEVAAVPLTDEKGSPTSKMIKAGYTPKADAGALKLGVN